MNTPGRLSEPRPPVAEQLPKVDVVHGMRRGDDYFWLREKTNRAVLAYLEAENSYTDARMKSTQAIQAALYREMVGHIKETDRSVPFREGGCFYYSRTEKGRQYRIHCRKRESLAADEEITLDLNKLAEGLKFLSLGEYQVSDDGNLLAYSLDATGFRQFTLRVKDLRTGRILPDQIEKAGSVVWASDNQTLFYTVEDPAKRFYRLYEHRLGARADELVYEEKDERFELSAQRSRSKAFIFLESASHTASEVRFLPADRPDGPWRLVVARAPDHEYEVEHHGDYFYIRSNDRGRNFRLVKAPVADPDPKGWEEIIPHRSEVMLEGVLCFRDHYVLREREQGLPQLRIIDFRTGASRRVPFPEPVYSVFPETNPEFGTRRLRYGYTSFITPRSVFDIDMETGETELLKRDEVPGGYNPSLYQSERLYATSPDGTRVPVSLVSRKGARRDGKSPLLLTGYGSYGYPWSVHFDASRLSLLDRGMIFAVGHIRGGGEMGKAWHDQGRMMNKMNTFTDFIAVAQFLIAEEFTTADRLVIEGGSAGGLLMGAVTNLRPDLFRAVVAHVPFVDVINTMLDETLPLTVGEFEEWGNPKERKEYDYMMRYSPYDNVKPGNYPAMLIKTSFNDSQVMYWEPAKYVAKLRALKTDARPLLLKVNMNAGHGGAAGRYDHLRETAFDYAFILTQLGISR